jgi:MerR family transcriptional regulator, light-induced transcriptional regulator
MSTQRRIGLREAAERLGVHYMTAYRYVRTGQLPAERDGAQWTVAVTDLRRVTSGRRTPARHRSARAERPARLVDRLVAGDEAGAWKVVEGALASGSDPADVYLDVLVPALRSIGDGWERGNLTVADEHRASAVAARIIGRLGPRFARRGRTRGTVVLGAPPGEQHGLPGAILADVLRVAGFEPLDLGANTPALSFAETALGADRLVAVVIGATTLSREAAVRKVVLTLRRAEVTAPVLLGGAAIVDADHAGKLGADGFSGHDAVAAVAAVEAAAAAARSR